MPVRRARGQPVTSSRRRRRSYPDIKPLANYLAKLDVPPRRSLLAPRPLPLRDTLLLLLIGSGIYVWAGFAASLYGRMRLVVVSVLVLVHRSWLVQREARYTEFAMRYASLRVWQMESDSEESDPEETRTLIGKAWDEPVKSSVPVLHAAAAFLAMQSHKKQVPETVVAATAPAPGAVAKVLRNGELFRHIMAFKRGLPNLVLEFERDHELEWFHTLGSQDEHPKTGMLPKLAIIKNNMAVFRMLHRLQDFAHYRRNPTLQFTDVIRFAAVHNRLDVLEYLHSATGGGARLKWSLDLLDDTVRAGHLQIVRWLQTNHPESCTRITSEALDSTAAGNFKLLKYLHVRAKRGFTTDAMDLAAEHGYLQIVRFLHEHRKEGCTTHAMDEAACNGHLAVVKFLHRNRSEGCTTSAMDGAARNGHLEIVKFLHKNRSEGCTTNAMDSAAQFNRMDVIQFLHKNRQEGFTEWAMSGAAANGHLGMVHYLHRELHLEYVGSSASIAVQNGHFDVFEYLCSNYPASAHDFSRNG